MNHDKRDWFGTAVDIAFYATLAILWIAGVILIWSL